MRSAHSAVVWMVVIAVYSGVGGETARAEVPAPELHWGALGYPDQGPVLEFGISFNRFTEFDEEGRRFNNIEETIGLNEITVSWTEHWKRFDGVSTNLTVSGGPTRDQPTRYFQNEIVHEQLRGFKKVPVNEIREQTDFTASGSVTKWFSVGKADRLIFGGLGATTGSLYHEIYGRTGVRRWSPVDTFSCLCKEQRSWWLKVLEPLRFSGMYRYSRIWEGAAFRALAQESHAVQGSVSYGWLRAHDHYPLFEVEVGVTLDSGIFIDHLGDSLEERFWTFALRVHPFRLESWNDQINSKDFGPTYGVRLMMDLYEFLPEGWQWR